MLKKLSVAAAAAGAMAIPLAGLASADPQTPDNGANPANTIQKHDNPTFEDSGHNSIQNSHNTQLRFGYDGRVAIPGNGAGNANENSAVSPYTAGGSGGIVAPPGRY